MTDSVSALSGFGAAVIVLRDAKNLLGVNVLVGCFINPDVK
jgi:hypothetical protein